MSLVLTVLLALSSTGTVAATPAAPQGQEASAAPAVAPVGISSFSFQPSSVTVNSQTSGSVSISGGTPPYFLWFNNTPPNCGPQSTPVTTSSQPFQFNCQPSATGNYNVHLDIADSSSPAGHNSASASLTVNSNSGNGNGNNGGNGSGTNGFSLPSGLFQVALLVSLAFVGSMVALAAGMVATAVILSRRLRQLKEVLERTIPPPANPPK